MTSGNRSECAERRTRILRIAGDTFRAKGYEATSMSEIADKVGGSKATLWTHFRSKEDLFTQALLGLGDQLRLELAELLPLHGDLPNALVHFSEELLETVLKPEWIALHRLAEAEAHKFPHTGERYYETGLDSFHQNLSASLRQYIHRGDLRSVDATVAAKTLTALICADYYREHLLKVVKTVDLNRIRNQASFAVDCFLKIFATTH